MDKRDGREGNQQGAQQHAEGQHGERTHSRFLEQIHQPMSRGDEATEESDGNERDGDANSGRDGQRR